ncbi:hypothetical protein DSCOOX_03200 [Desulfosarcina ovata subsp. ovata]|uniref:Uncharacterized protein n=1 Tax=Desulfosarcina ovata subsp. ovata TaxID=2752305 RepID=A0A5K8A4C1_9BACT|nr:hypothetical protein DSCOOX_03200 [Desulfosarcina ovata subsp. ovata]
MLPQAITDDTDEIWEEISEIIIGGEPEDEVYADIVKQGLIKLFSTKNAEIYEVRK